MRLRPARFRALRDAGAAALVAAALAVPSRAAALELFGTIGGTGAIAGDVDEGGFSLSAAALWPQFERRLAFGVTGFADDLGSETEDLMAGNVPVGQAERVHRAVYGVAFRVDGRLAAGRWEPYGSGTWGFYHLRDDHLGSTIQEWTSIGLSLGAGIRHPLRGRSTIGAEARVQRLFNDRASHYVSAALEWGWR